MPLQLPAVPNFNVQVPDFLGAQQKMLELRALQGNVALQPLQKQAAEQSLQAQTLQNRKAQMELQSQQAMMEAWSDPNFLKEFSGTPGADQSGLGFDPTAMQKALVNRGVMPADAMAMSNQFIERSKNIAETQKTIAQGNEAAAGERAKGYKVLSDRIAGILDAPVDKAGPMLAALKGDLVHKSKAFAGVPQDDLAHVFAADLEHLPAMASMLGFDAQIADYHKSKADASKAAGEANKINIETDPNNPADPNLRKQKYETILGQIQKNGIASISPENMEFARSYELGQRKTTTQSDSLGVTSTNTSAPSGIAAAGGRQTVTHSNTSTNTQQSGDLRGSLVDEIGQYKLNPQMLSRVMVKHPELIAQVAQKYPDWNQPNYNSINKLIADYTSGKSAQSINAINTAMGHVKELDDAIDALQNGNVNLLNKIGNFGSKELGLDPVSKFNLIVHRVGPEISSAYVPGGGGEKERLADEADFSSSLSPKQLHTNAAETVKLLRSKIDALQNQYQQTTGRQDFNQKFITPAAQAGLDKFSKTESGGNKPSGGLIYARDPQGQLHSAPAGTKLPAGWKADKGPNR